MFCYFQQLQLLEPRMRVGFSESNTQILYRIMMFFQSETLQMSANSIFMLEILYKDKHMNTLQCAICGILAIGISFEMEC